MRKVSDDFLGASHRGVGASHRGVRRFWGAGRARAHWLARVFLFERRRGAAKEGGAFARHDLPDVHAGVAEAVGEGGGQVGHGKVQPFERHVELSPTQRWQPVSPLQLRVHVPDLQTLGCWIWSLQSSERASQSSLVVQALVQMPLHVSPSAHLGLEVSEHLSPTPRASTVVAPAAVGQLRQAARPRR